MKIGGVIKLSLVDYPGKTSAALFTIGCNIRCGYCHNPELVLPERFANTIPEDDILAFLKTRVDKLDSVTISGGEPTMHQDLPDFARRIKDLGFLVKIDSNGTHPQMLRQMIEEKTIDFVAMDVKAPLDKYQAVVARPVDLNALVESIDLIMSSDIGHEFRTTIVKSQLSFEDMEKIAKLVNGADRFALQKFRPGKTLNPQFNKETTYSDDEFEELKTIMERYVKLCVIH